MRSISEYFQRNKIVIDLSQELSKNKALYYKHHGGEIKAHNVFMLSDRSKLSPLCRKYLLLANTPAAIAEVFTLMQLVSIGPKVFRPTHEQLIVLEQMALNVLTEDFNLPFHTVVFEFPEEYFKDIEDKPTFLIMTLDKSAGILLTMLMLRSGQAIKQTNHLNDGETIEEMLVATFNVGSSVVPGEELTQQELTINHTILRAVLSYCLLIDSIGGAKCHGPLNPAHYTRLQKRARHGGEAAKRDFKQHPILYAVDQEIALHTTTHSGDKSEHTGRVQSPHWRRGHFRSQPHGPNNSLRKTIRVPAVFINADLFKGDLFSTKSTYYKKD